MKSKFTFFLFLLLSCSLVAQRDKMLVSAQNALGFLLLAQRDDGCISDSTNPLFDVWETILVADALQNAHATAYRTEVQRALSFLQQQENPEALICHNSKNKAFTCIETSAYYLELRRKEDDPRLNEKLALISRMQEADGSWKILNPDVNQNISFVSVTAFVVHLFESYGYTSYAKKAALEFIASKQLADGSWGQCWEYYNSPGYALWQCLGALKNEADYASSYQRGLNFIIGSQLDDGSWRYIDPAIVNTPSPELQTALMLRCLVGEDAPACKRALMKGIDFLLQQQLANGSWEGGYFPIPNARYKKKEYLLATSLILQTLSDVLNAPEE